MPGRANGHAGTDHRCYILHAWVGLDFGDAALQVLELVRDTGWYGVCAVHVRHHHACDDSDTCQQLRLAANGKMAKLKRSNEKQGQRSGNGQQHNNAELYAECPFCREKKIGTRPDLALIVLLLLLRRGDTPCARGPRPNPQKVRFTLVYLQAKDIVFVLF